MEDWTKEEAFRYYNNLTRLKHMAAKQAITKANQAEAKSHRAVEYGEPREGEHDD